tara:strand:+ start:1612 stop:2862 length:1251 start_codon:yes stop_codon:yes gene_type:complete
VILNTNFQTNRMNKTLAIIFTFSVIIIKGQNNFLLPDSSNQILMNTKGGLASSSIPQEFMNKFIFPGFIDESLKDAASLRMKDENYFGGILSGNINVMMHDQNKGSKNEKIYGFGFGTNLEADLKFSKDLFDLTFYGNKAYANKTLNLNNTSFNSLAYSYVEFSFGQSMINKKMKSSIWADLGFLIGHGNTSIDFEKGSLFTEENGDYLEINLSESSMFLSDTTSTNFLKGLGAKADLYYSLQNRNSRLFLSTENIGGIFWRNIASAKLDTTLNFEGIEIDNIFQLADSVWSEVGSIDSLISTTNSNTFRKIPVDFSAYFRKNLSLIYFDVLARYRLFANYTPYLRTGLNFNFRNIKPGVTASYGGYSTFNFGINTDIDLFNTLKIQLGTNNILGSIVPNSTSAIDAYIGMRLRIN